MLGVPNDVTDQVDEVLRPMVDAGYSRNDDPSSPATGLDPAPGADLEGALDAIIRVNLEGLDPPTGVNLEGLDPPAGVNLDGVLDPTTQANLDAALDEPTGVNLDGVLDPTAQANLDAVLKQARGLLP